MQSMDSGSRSGGRRLKDRLAQLLRPANCNSLLRSPCSSSSSTSTAFTAAGAAATTTETTTVSTSSTSTTAANYTIITGALLPRAEPFSAALGRLRHPPPDDERARGDKERRCKDGSSSSRHGSRRRCNNAAVGMAGVRTLSSNPYGFTSSGEDDDDDDTDDCYVDDDTEAFLSSDSAAFYMSRRKPPPPPPTDKTHRHRQRRRPRCRRPAASCMEATCGDGAVREPGFLPLVATAAAEQVRRGLAVVKRSRDPYGDFRESMVEMIVGRQVFGAAELERLLRSYLSLNAPRFHPVILQAFSDIWVVLHGG
ncbi:transcription repressor OFP7-like [Panicum miliaceum]|uniref:Transcription repressor n=1 Tax=Panicum miliaceum TaxID=4540 RepID=A0A3L6SWP9_PANMI|nr:transcription repressor OFP7-like [Panicum miliaceum]